MACGCLATKLVSASSSEASVPATRGTDAIPSTSSSGVINHCDAIINASMEEEMQDRHINTTEDYSSVYAELLDGADSLVDKDSLPAVHMVKENEKEPYQVTVFRPLFKAQKPNFDSKAQKTKFDRYKEDSSFDSVDSLDFNKNN